MLLDLSFAGKIHDSVSAGKWIPFYRGFNEVRSACDEQWHMNPSNLIGGDEAGLQ